MKFKLIALMILIAGCSSTSGSRYYTRDVAPDFKPLAEISDQFKMVTPSIEGSVVIVPAANRDCTVLKPEIPGETTPEKSEFLSAEFDITPWGDARYTTFLKASEGIGLDQKSARHFSTWLASTKRIGYYEPLKKEKHTKSVRTSRKFYFVKDDEVCKKVNECNLEESIVAFGIEAYIFSCSQEST